jgi:hypothetical protein
LFLYYFLLFLNRILFNLLFIFSTHKSSRTSDIDRISSKSGLLFLLFFFCCFVFLIYYIHFPAPTNRQEDRETNPSRQDTTPPFNLIVPSLSPRRPGGDYDVSLNYKIEDEFQYGETSTSGMIKGAILEADARNKQMSTKPSTSRRRTPERPSSRRQGEERSHERSHERSRTPPYRRQFGIYRNERSSTSYRSPLDFRDRGLGRDERSGTPWQYRPRSRNVSPLVETYRSRSRNVSPPAETRDSSLNEGEYNLLQKFSRYFF